MSVMLERWERVQGVFMMPDLILKAAALTSCKRTYMYKGTVCPKLLPDKEFLMVVFSAGDGTEAGSTATLRNGWKEFSEH